MPPPLAHGIDAATLEALPRGPGVYIFRGEGPLPLYIGKSVDIRARVLAHLRTEDEAEMLARSRHIDCIETAGEIGALLLEAQLIKQMHPLFNVRLRRWRQLCCIRLQAGEEGWQPDIVSGREAQIGHVPELYGLFGSVRAAQQRLRALADQHRLCQGLLGLENIGARGCFGLQLKTCLGACVGHEPRDAHDERLRAALQDMQVHAWPFAGAVDLVEQSGDWVQRHRLHDWRYLGTWCSRTGQTHTHAPPGFDLDTYKIVVKPVMMGTVRVQAA